MTELRPYQHRAIEQLRLRWRESPILVLPPRAGKTVVAAEIVRLGLERPGSVLFLAHRRELVAQARAQLERRGVTGERAIVESIQTLARRPTIPGVTLVIVDECHHAASPQWRELLERYRGAGASLVGLSGTPYRMDGRGLAPIFGALVQPISIADLVALGHLVEPRVFTWDVPALDALRTVRGDYEQKKLSALMRKSRLVGDVIGTWLRHGAPKPAIAFGVDRAHAREIAERFCAAGVRAEYLDSGTSKRDRTRIVAGLRDGTVELVSNCEILGEGVDFPALACCILDRPTQSMALHRQMVARVMTPSPGKAAPLVLDHAGNHNRLGAVTEELEVSLTERVRRSRAAAVRTCPGCHLVVLVNIATCPECGHELLVRQDPTRKKLRTEEGELVEFRSRDARLAWYAAQVATASMAGMRIGWARKQYKTRFGVWPRDVAEIEAANYRCRGHEPKTERHGPWVVTTCDRCRAVLGREIA